MLEKKLIDFFSYFIVLRTLLVGWPTAAAGFLHVIFITTINHLYSINHNYEMLSVDIITVHTAAAAADTD